MTRAVSVVFSGSVTGHHGELLLVELTLAQAQQGPAGKASCEWTGKNTALGRVSADGCSSLSEHDSVTGLWSECAALWSYRMLVLQCSRVPVYFNCLLTE